MLKIRRLPPVLSGVVLGTWIVVAATPAARCADAAPAALPFGVVPQQSPARLAQMWTPFLQYLSARTGLRLEFETAPNIPAFERRLAAGRYPIAYMNPYHYVVFHRHPGYQVFAHPAGKLRGILVVARDGPIRRLEDLRGRTVAFPAPAAFAASVVPRAWLKKRGIRIKPRYVFSHDSVYLAVAAGLYPAGGGILRTFHAMAPGVRARLRVLWRSPPYTPHAFAAAPCVSPRIVARIRAAMLGMAHTPEGTRLLRRLGFRAITAANDAEYDDIRALRLKIAVGGRASGG